MEQDTFQHFAMLLAKHCADKGIRLRPWQIGHSSSVIEIMTPGIPTLLYIRVNSAAPHGCWSLWEFQVNALVNSASDWYLVLLKGKRRGAYLITSDEVRYFIGFDHWHKTANVIRVPERTLKRKTRVPNLKSLIDRLEF